MSLPEQARARLAVGPFSLGGARVHLGAGHGADVQFILEIVLEEQERSEDSVALCVLLKQALTLVQLLDAAYNANGEDLDLQ